MLRCQINEIKHGCASRHPQGENIGGVLLLSPESRDLCSPDVASEIGCGDAKIYNSNLDSKESPCQREMDCLFLANIHESCQG